MSLVPTLSTGQLETLHQEVITLAAAFLLGYEGATRAGYTRDLNSWLRWCREHNVDP